MKNIEQNLVIFVSSFFFGAAVAATVTFGIIWFRMVMNGDACTVPGWEWCKYTTGVFLSVLLGGVIALVGELTMHIWHRFSKNLVAEVMKGTLASLAEVLGAVTFFSGMPTLLWWGLYLA